MTISYSASVRMFAPLTIYFLAAVLAVSITSGHAKPPQPIVGGRPVSPGEYPFIVSLRVNNQHACGGSIISARHVLTAAHCVAQLTSPMTVMTGSIYSSWGGKSHGTKISRYHRQYTKGNPSSPNDLAIIELATPIQFNGLQNKIPIRSTPVPSGRMATAIGWGWKSASAPYTVNALEQVTLSTLTTDECQKYFPYQLYSHQICAVGPPGKGVCAGDSGGPLVLDGELIGVVSYGIPCAVGHADIFTSTYHYRDWINSCMAQ